MFIGESKIWIMIYGYIRVSSDKQTVENQRFEIERFCKVNNLHIDGWIDRNESIQQAAVGGATEESRERRRDHLFGVVTAWALAVYDYGDTKYLYEEGVLCVDDQG